MKAAGLTISSVKIGPDGTITFMNGTEVSEETAISPDDALAQWEASRRTARPS